MPVRSAGTALLPYVNAGRWAVRFIHPFLNITVVFHFGMVAAGMNDDDDNDENDNDEEKENRDLMKNTCVSHLHTFQ